MAKVNLNEIVCCDFETFFSPTYSLRAKKYNTSSYIMDPQFLIHCCAIKIGKKKSVCYPRDKAIAVLKSIDWSTHDMLAHNCLHGDTEVLTRHGWAPIKDVSVTEEIMQWDPVTQAMSWTFPTEKITHHAEKLIKWDSQYHSCEYTPEHRMYIGTPNRRAWRAETVSTVASMGQNNVYIPLSGVFHPSAPLDLTPVEARLMEAIRADGSWQKGKKISMRAKFKKAHKKQRFQELLIATNQPYSIYNDPVRTAVETFTVKDTPLMDRIYALLTEAKCYGQWVLNLTTECRLAVLDEAANWDGSATATGNSYKWSCANAATVEAMQLMAHTTGWSFSGRWVDNARGFNAANKNAKLYIATVKEKHRAKLIVSPVEVTHNADVYCFKVPTKAFLIRRNDRVLITGNCFFDGAIAAWHLGIKPRRYFCTLQMTRGLHSDMSRAGLDAICQFYGIPGKTEGLNESKGLRELPPPILKNLMDYCNNDNEKCFEIFKKQVAVFPQEELDLVDLTISMFTDPVFELDVKRCEASLAFEMGERLRFIAISGHAEKELTSTEKFVSALAALGVEAPRKVSKYNGEVTYALSEQDGEFMMLQEHDDIRVVRLVQGRLAAKSTMMETRAWRFLQAHTDLGKLPVMLNYYGAKCVPGNTEVLTRGGWIKIKDWHEQDAIAQVVPGSREITFLAATKFIGEQEREWVVVDAPYLQCAFTKGHTMPYLQHGTFTWDTMQAGDIRDRKTWYAPVAGELGDSGNLTPIQTRVLAMIQADGSFETDSGVGRKLRISVKKPRKIERALHLLIKAGITFEIKDYESAPGYKHFIVRLKDYPVWMTEARKFFGPWLLDSTPEAREAFIDELQHWDGWVQSNQQCYSSSERVNADWVATLCHLTGRSASILPKERGEGRRTNYVVTIRERGHCLVRQRHVTSEELWDVPVCATTQTGYFLARSNGRIFVTGNTGRWSGANRMNLQNLPTATKDYPMAGELRKSILAPAGHVIIAPDSAQIEARVIAWVSGHVELLDRFRNKEDVYKWMASLIYGVAVELIDGEQRFIGKIAVLGLGYGMGAKRFQTTLAMGVMGPPMFLTMAECQKIVKMYRKINKCIVDFWAECEQVLENIVAGRSGAFGPNGILEYDEQSIWLPNGMGLHYPGLKASYTPEGRRTGFSYMSAGVKKHIYGGLLCENIVQALAGVVIRQEMTEVRAHYKTLKLRKGERAVIATMTHDEIVSVIPARLSDKLLKENLRIMRTPPKWAPDCPIWAAADGGAAVNYSV